MSPIPSTATTTRPMKIAAMARPMTLPEAVLAPSTSPDAHLLLTCVAKTREKTPKGQNRSVDTTAQMRWFGGGDDCREAGDGCGVVSLKDIGDLSSAAPAGLMARA